MRYVLLIAMVLALGVGRCFAGESVSSEKDLDDALQALRGLDGVAGGSAKDMDVVLNMLQKPEMEALVQKFNSQLSSQMSDGTIDQAAIEAYVRENLTKEDVEKVLGQKVNDKDFDRAVSKPVDSGDLRRLQGRLGDDVYIVE